MKYLFLLITFSVSFGYGQSEMVKPKNLEELFQYLDQNLDDTTLYNFKNLPEEYAVSSMNSSFKFWFKSKWGIWKQKGMKEFFNNHGISLPINMSRIALTSYYRYLHSNPINMQNQLETINTEYFNVQYDTLDDGSIEFYFPEIKKRLEKAQEELNLSSFVGDTVLVTLSGTKGLFNRFTIFYGVAEITGYYSPWMLQLTLVALNKDERIKANYKVGDVINEQIFSCKFVPPKTWKR